MRITDAVHEHGRTCYWDHRECRWVCTPTPAPVEAPPPAVRRAPSGPPPPAPAPPAVEPAPALR